MTLIVLFNSGALTEYRVNFVPPPPPPLAPQSTGEEGEEEESNTRKMKNNTNMKNRGGGDGSFFALDICAECRLNTRNMAMFVKFFERIY